MSYRNDPRWITAREAIAIETDDSDADLVRRMRASTDMYEIQCDWQRQTAWALQLRAS